MDIRNCQRVNYQTKNTWSNTLGGTLFIINNKDVKKTNWNILPMSNQFEYSKEIFKYNNNNNNNN